SVWDASLESRQCIERQVWRAAICLALVQRCYRKRRRGGEDVAIARERDRRRRQRHKRVAPDRGIVAVQIPEIFTLRIGRARIDQPTIGGADSITASVVDECAGRGKRDGLAGD